MPRHITEWSCNWRGFAGANERECGFTYRANVAPTTAVARAIATGWEFVIDGRLEARDLDPDRPRALRLCPGHGAKWCEWFPRTRMPLPQAVRHVAALQNRQPTLFNELDVRVSARGLHDDDFTGRDSR